MVLSGKGKIVNNKEKKGGKSYDRFSIRLDIDLARHEDFPFKEGDQVVITIEKGNGKGKLIIEEFG